MTEVVKEDKPIPLSQLYWKDYLALKNYNTDINKMCELCIADQKKKFGSQTIQCNGLATTPPDKKKLFPLLTKEEQSLIEQIYNPYAWAERNIKPTVFKHRWYQELMTRCTAKNSIYRCGRRVGKSFGFAVKALHKIFLASKEKPIKVLMLAPAESQVKEFFEIVETLVMGFKEEFMDPTTFLTGDRKKPYYEFDFSNGSQLRGLVAANDAKTVRGQGKGVQVILLDEVDFIPTEAITAVMGVLLDNPSVELWVSSTPSGKAKLYELENSSQYRGFHYPSFVIPHMSDQLQADLRVQYGHGLKWIHEVLAEYGTDDAGVFQGFFIDRCRTEGSLQHERDNVLLERQRYIVILGVDWNDDKVGTRLVTVAFDRIEKKFITVDISRVSKDGWTQVAAVEKLIELNRTYKYDQMYLDEGYGTSQIQFIKKYAMSQFGQLPPDHPDLKLNDVVGINFSSNIELNDVETNEVIKKDMKSYIVDNATRYLERLAFKFDTTYEKELLAQMENYVVLRTSPTGRKVYAAREEEIGDHDLDAWMLALLGFNLEYQEISKGIDSRALVAGVLRNEAGHPALVSSVFGMYKSGETPSSQFNNLFAPLNMNGKGSKNREDFHNKYVLNSQRSMDRGLFRKQSRSKFK